MELRCKLVVARPILILAGPTASGKSAAALQVARKLDGTIINADALQIYADLQVLSARPSKDEQAQVPHRLYGVMDGAERCSAGIWLQQALIEIEAAHAGGRVPVLVGGTGLYLRSLMEGLADIPAVPEAVRAEAIALHAALGGEAFRARLAEFDPQAALRLQPGDQQRLIRAWEVHAATGRALSAWQARPTHPPPADWHFICGILIPERTVLYGRCDQRFEAMMPQGALAEVEALLARRLDTSLPVMKALGVPELAAYLAGQTSLPDAIALAQRSTRNYAKRQTTWFRHQLPPGSNRSVFFAQESVEMIDKIFAFIRNLD